MLGFLEYTLEAGIIFVVLTVIYNGVYAGASYHRWERGYLLCSTAASYLLPLFKVRFSVDPVPRRPYEFLVEIVSRDPVDVVTLSHERTAQSSISDFLQSQIFENIIAVIFAIYIAGVAVKMVSYVNGIRRTLRLRQGEPEMLDDGIRVYRTDLNTVAFSFFGNIFLGRRVRELGDGELDTVISHEKNHIRGRHSIDTLVFGLYSVVQWMNPMVRIAQRQSRLVCENIADRNVSTNGGLTEYSRLILRLGIGVAASNDSEKKSSGSLRRRISQLLSTDSERLRRMRFVATIPLLAIMVSAYLLLAGMACPVSTGLKVPVDGKYRISAGYFENQKIMGADGVLYNASHRQIDLQVVPDSRVIAPADCMVESVDSSMVLLAMRHLHINIGGMAAESISPGDTIHCGQVLGHAIGGTPMYIRVSDSTGLINPGLVFDL